MNEQAIAQTTASATPAQGSTVGTLIGFAPLLMIMVLFYFLMIRPQNQEKKKREEMLTGIQRGDKVLTRGGIYGTVADIREQVLVLKINENSKIEVERSYVDTVQKQG
jgi:preprotein translocase subunit YajC